MISNKTLYRAIVRSIGVRIIAGCLAFLLAFMDGAQMAQAALSAPARFLLPAQFGHIDESFKGSSDKTVFFIQDAHDSLEAQMNIARLIYWLTQKKSVQTVFEEGYEGPVPTEKFFDFIGNERVKRQTSFFLLDKLRIGGAEYAHINRARDFKLVGADSLAQYRENVEHYRQAARHQKNIEEDLSALLRPLTALIEKNFPSEMKKILKQQRRLRDGMPLFIEYVKELRSVYGKTSPEAEATFSRRYPALTALLLKIKNPNREDTSFEKIFVEIPALERNIAAHFLKEKHELRAFYYYQTLRSLQKLNQIELAPEEYAAVRAIPLDTQKVSDFLSLNLGRTFVFSREWEKQIRYAKAFYETAQVRDKTVEKTMLGFSRQTWQRNAALVFGGFHAGRIKSALKELGFSYYVITPHISGKDEIHSAYYKQLMSAGQHAFESSWAARAARPESEFVRAGERGESAILERIRVIAAFSQENGRGMHPLILNRLIESSLTDMEDEMVSRSEARQVPNSKTKPVTTASVSGMRWKTLVRLFAFFFIIGFAQNLFGQTEKSQPKDPQALRAAIEKFYSKKYEERSAAIEAIAETGDMSKTSDLIEMVQKDDPLKSQAIIALGKLKAKEAVPVLIGLIEDRRSRKEIMEALGQIADERAVDVLIATYKEGILDVLMDKKSARDVAGEALTQIGGERVMGFFMEEMIKDSFGESAARLLARFGKPAFEAMLSALQNNTYPDKAKRLRLIRFLGVVGGNHALEYLLKLASESYDNEERMESVLDGLGGIQTPEAARAVFDLYALAFKARPPSNPSAKTPYLYSYSFGPDCEKALSSIGKAGADVLVEKMLDANAHGNLRIAAAKTLKALGLPESARALVSVTDEKELSYYAFEALEAIGDAAVPQMLTALSRPLPTDQKVKLIEVLAKIKSRSAVPALIEALKSTDSKIRIYAAYALKKIPDKIALNPLIEAGSAADIDVDTHNELGDALGEIGEYPDEVIRILKPLWTHSDMDLRTTAVLASLKMPGAEVDPAFRLARISVLQHEFLELSKSRSSNLPRLKKIVERFRALKAVEALDLLLEALEKNEDPEDLTATIISVLGDLNDERAAPAIQKHLASRWAGVVLNAAEALRKINKAKYTMETEMAEIKALLSNLSSKTDYINEGDKSAILRLGQTGYPETTALLVAALVEADSSYMQEEYVVGLKKAVIAKGAAAVPLLIQGLNRIPTPYEEAYNRNKIEERKKRVAQTLSKIRDPEAVEALRPLMSSRDHELVEAAVEGVSTAADPQDINAFVQLMNGPDHRMELLGLKALSHFRNEAAVTAVMNTLTRRIEKKDIFEQFFFEAMLMLGKSGDPRVFPLLEKSAQSADERISVPAAQALGWQGDKRATLHIVRLLEKGFEKGDGMKMLIEALGRLKDPAGQDALIQSLNSKQEDVAAAALKALEDIASPKSLFFASLAKGSAPSAEGEQLIQFSREALESGRQDIRERARQTLTEHKSFRYRDWLQMKYAANPILTSVISIIAGIITLIFIKHAVLWLILMLGAFRLPVAEMGLRFILRKPISSDTSIISYFYQVLAAKALCRYGSKLSEKSFELLKTKVLHPGRSDKRFLIPAIQAIENVSPSAAENALIDLALKPGVSIETKAMAREWLSRMPAPRAAFFGALLSGKHQEAAAIEGAADLIKEAFLKQNLEVQEAVAEVCLILKDDSLAKDFIEVLGKNKKPVFARVLGEFQVEAAIPVLVGSMNLSDDMGNTAAEALVKINSPESLFWSRLYRGEIAVLGDEHKAADGTDRYQWSVALLGAGLKHPNKQIQINCIQVMVRAGELAFVPDVIKLLDDKDMPLRTAAMKALEDWNITSAIPKIITLLPWDAAARAFIKIDWSHDGAAFVSVIIANMTAKKEVRAILNQGMKAVLQKNPDIVISEKSWLEIMGAHHFKQVVEIMESHPQLIRPGISWMPALMKLQKKIAAESEARPTEFKAGVYNAIDAYLKSFVFGQESETMEVALENIYSFLSITYDNVTLVLSAFRNMEMPAGVFLPLRDALPANNPLTRIIRMLGESKSIVGGSLEVTTRLQMAGKFQHLLDLVVAIAKKRSRAAPQEVMGVLEVLAGMPDIETWGPLEWKMLREQIDRYYAAGFKVMSYTIFRYFIAHEDDPVAVAELKRDVEQSLGNIAWGTFSGFSDEFKRKYQLTTADEMALLGKYMPVKNEGVQGYVGIYEKVKTALHKRGSDWVEEVDPGLRNLYRLGGSRSMLVYDPEGNSKHDREALHRKLSSLADFESGKEPDLIVRENLFDMSDIGRDRLRKAIVRIMLTEAGFDPAIMKKVPQDEAAIQDWLQRWSGLFLDTFKLHVSARLQKIAREEIEKLSSEKLDEAGLALHQIPAVDLPELKFNIDKDAVNILSAKDKTTADMQSLFVRKWFARTKLESLRDEKKFNKWVDEGVPGFSKKLYSKIIREKGASDLEPAEIERILRKALAAARSEKLDGSASASAKERKSLLQTQVVQKLGQIFTVEMEGVKTELGLFSVVETETRDPFYVGFFDDLLHLMGFMLSGVCTWESRADQVATTSYHFGKMALKNSSGRVLGVSQVQLLKAGIKGRPLKQSPQGWAVLSLPGINFDESGTGIERGRAVLAILEAAQRLARENGLSAAVIPKAPGIHSNSQSVHTEIQTLLKKGWLTEAKLSSSVKLAYGTYAYPYDDVYIVNIPEEVFMLSSSSLEQRLETEKQQLDQLEKELQLPFGDGIGDLIFEKVPAGSEAENLHAAIEEAIKLMPEETIGNIRINVNMLDTRVKIQVDGNSETTRVHKSDSEIALILGRDILYRPGKIDHIALREAVAELFTAYMLDDYDTLKEAAKTNENAYFKIENIKALLNYRSYLAQYYKTIHKFNWEESRKLIEDKPIAMSKALFAQDGDSLDRFTQGWQGVKQFNLFLNLMGDADPAFLVSNYIHLLSSPEADFNDGHFAGLIEALAEKDVLGAINFAALRNNIKEFFFHGRVHLKMGDATVEKDRFDYFDETARLNELSEGLATTRSEGEFLRLTRSLLVAFLPLSPDQLETEMNSIIDKEIFSSKDRLEELRGFLADLLRRRIGGKALASILDHFNLTRELENIPYFRLSSVDLDEGLDADDYGFLEYAQGSAGFDLVFHEPGQPAEEEPSAAADPDWVAELFPFPEVRNRSELRDEGKNATHALRKIRNTAQSAQIFINAEDFAFFSAEQKKEFFHAALTAKNVRIIVYNDRGQGGDRELAALLKSERAESTEENLADAQLRYGKRGVPALHISKTILPALEAREKTGANISFFKAQGEKSGVLAAALLWAWSGGEKAHVRGVNRDEDGFWIVASELIQVLQAAYENELVFSISV